MLIRLGSHGRTCLSLVLQTDLHDVSWIGHADCNAAGYHRSGNLLIQGRFLGITAEVIADWKIQGDAYTAKYE